ncbi:MAG: CpaF family protein [Anaerolineales bacterium]|jgi:pilus assembly protein CpaF|nr:MAG: CpaF family protein [Anaerolineales bacterium]
MYDYDRICTSVQGYCVEQEVAVPRWRGAQAGERFAFRAGVLRAIKELQIPVDERELQSVAEEVAKRIVGLGVLHPFLEQDGTEEIIVRNGYVTIERDGSLEPVGYVASDDYFYRLARRIADMEGKGLGAADPMIKVGLPDGSRFAATIPPLSREGTAINIRRFAKKKLSMEDLVGRGSADTETIDFLTEVANSLKVSIVFSGRPGAGKTTWLNAFSQHLPERAQLSVVETFAELQPQIEHHHHLVVEEETEQMSEAINTAILRMRPDVLMIGEVVSREAVQYILALNLGIVSHTTTHSQNARMALVRLENLARREIPVEELRPVIGYGLGLVVHLAKDYDPEKRSYRRYVKELLAVDGYENGHYVFNPLKEWTGDGWTPLREGMARWD